jgi:hypothetical protein
VCKVLYYIAVDLGFAFDSVEPATNSKGRQVPSIRSSTLLAGGLTSKAFCLLKRCGLNWLGKGVLGDVYSRHSSYSRSVRIKTPYLVVRVQAIRIRKRDEITALWARKGLSRAVSHFIKIVISVYV